MNREQKKQHTRIQIKDAALSLFAEQGYEATSIEQIVKQVGIAKGTFFNYFSSKDELICDLLSMFVMGEAKKLKDKPGPIIPRMRMILFQLVQQFPLNKQLGRALFQATLGSSKALDAHNDVMHELIESLIPIIRQAQESGELRQDMPPAMIAGLAYQTYFGALILWSMSDEQEPIYEQMAITFDLFFKGIQA